MVHWSKKLLDKAMTYWNLHKKFELPMTNVHRDLTFQSWVFLIGGEPNNCSALKATLLLSYLERSAKIFIQLEWIQDTKLYVGAQVISYIRDS